jgi:eukaryotic-like serine/threonine-protein kinase
MSSVPSVVAGTYKWHVGKRIGGGGFAEVFLCRRPDTPAFGYAIKFFPDRPGAEREAIFQQIDSARNVVPIMDHGGVGDLLFIVMPLASQSLQDLCDHTGALEITTAIGIAIDVATTLADINGRVVHRDLKPDNILLIEGHWCLTDFGIARYAEAATSPSTRKFAMTAPYAAPEQWRLERATSATDVYALGIVLHLMVSGSLPFPGPTPDQWREQHLHESPAPVPSSLDRRLANLLSECLFKAPELRPKPEQVLSRLQLLITPASDAVSGMHAMIANEIAKDADTQRENSILRSDETKRKDLFVGALVLFDRLITPLQEQLSSGSTSHEERQESSDWSVSIGGATVTIRRPVAEVHDAWNTSVRPPFDVIASADISVTRRGHGSAELGRSSSLWFCNYVADDQYDWWELSFDGLMELHSRRPFSLRPGIEAAKALVGPSLEYSVAWVFGPLNVDPNVFVDRWASIISQILRPEETDEPIERNSS